VQVVDRDSPEFKNAGQYSVFRTGFGDGAKSNAKRMMPDAYRASYERGYEEGRNAKRIAMTSFASEIGYDPSHSMLREQDNGT
jgi:hypothetical protein